MLFSQRNGLKSAKKVIQIDRIDDETRNSLWTVFHECVIRSFESNFPLGYGNSPELRQSNLSFLFFNIWYKIFKIPIDTLPSDPDKAIRIFRDYFFTSQWNELLDCLEVIAVSPPVNKNEDFVLWINEIFTKENFGYRFLNSRITQITSEQELETIDQGINSSTKGAQIHLSQALALLSDRVAPDYRNSIKESISSVESICKVITKSPSATLGDAIKKLREHFQIHPAMEKAFLSLYGYTSDANGIRHSLIDEPILSYDEAKLMLVSCSSFVNFLVSKCATEGIEL